MSKLEDIDIDIKKIQVRYLSHPDEIKRWNTLMISHHYLPFKGLHGRSIRHVAEYEDTWLALLGWQGGAFKLSPRDRFIGWSQDQQFSRLHFIAQNARFLVLERIPNLASRVLTLSLKRLSRDMEEVHGHKVFLAETFVDPSRFKGSCYKACGWQSLGYSKGFSRIRQPGTQVTAWKANHQPKEIFVKLLTADATQQLSSSSMTAQKTSDRKNMKGSKLQSLYDHFSQTIDPRRAHGKRYSMAFMMTLVGAARLCGFYGVKETIFYGSSLPQPILKRIGAYYCPMKQKYRVPAVSTLHDLMAKLDPRDLQKSLSRFMDGHKSDTDAIAFDGKVIKGASRRNDKDSKQMITQVAGFQHGTFLPLDQVQVPDKTNEITAVRTLVNRMDVEGKAVTVDAGHCNQETARVIRKNKADYVFTAVKANQKKLKKSLENLSDDDIYSSYTTRDNGHGRKETRRYDVFDLTEEKHQHIAQNFKDRTQAVKITRIRLQHNKTLPSVSVAYALTSLPPKKASAQRLGCLIRGHWGIENKLHYVRDVVYGEDKSQSHVGNIPAIWSQFNNLAIALITLRGDQCIKAKTTREKRVGFTLNQDKVMDTFMKPLQPLRYS